MPDLSKMLWRLCPGSLRSMRMALPVAAHCVSFYRLPLLFVTKLVASELHNGANQVAVLPGQAGFSQIVDEPGP